VLILVRGLAAQVAVACEQLRSLGHTPILNYDGFAKVDGMLWLGVYPGCPDREHLDCWRHRLKIWQGVEVIPKL
jgi:hypothetical protein